MLKFSGTVIWRLGTRAIVRKHSTPSATVFKTEKVDASSTRLSEKPEDEKDKSGNKTGGVPSATHTCQCFFTSQREIILIRRHLQAYKLPSLVAAAFASINSPDPPEGQKKPSSKSMKLSRGQQMDLQIQKAKDVDGLLMVAESPIVSRRHALKVVSVLSDWSSSNKVQLTSFEKDPRFLKLCRILARTPTSQAVTSLNMAEDLSTVLGITGDDEAARLIGNLSLPQMIKVMKALNQKGRRSTPLLRALAHNIVNQADTIDLKKSADLLFSMAALNFPDPVLLDRICSDVSSQLAGNSDKPAVVNSILVSLGLLKYRHEACLSHLAQWLTTHSHVVRGSDVASAVVTLATVNFDPPGCESLFEAATKLKENDLSKASAWLDLVFSLLILDKSTEAHLSSTLRPEFIDKLLASGEIPIPARRKLMAIDAYVALAHPAHPARPAPRLPADISVGVPLVYTKEKALYVQSVMDTFRNLVSSEHFLKKDCNSNMGFLYDGEFALNDKCNPVPLEKAANDKSVFRIAVLSLDYHDMCRKTPVPLGLFALYTRLLELKGFKVLHIPYTEYNPKDKLVARVQYIEKRLKQIVSLS